MYWLDFLAVLRRRWQVVGAGVVLSVLAVGALVTTVAPRYRVDSTIIVLPPARTGEDVTNRYASLPITSVSALVVQSLNSEDTAEQLHRDGLAGPAEVTGAVDGTSVVVLAAHEATPALAERHAAALQALATAKLQEWQAGTAPEEQLTVAEFIPAGQPLPEQGSRLRAAAAGLVLCLTGTLGLAVLLDRRRRKARPSGAPVAVGVEPADLAARGR